MSFTFAPKTKNMPTNKNALARYKYLDDLLSDRHHYYDKHDLLEKCNERLRDAGIPEIGLRCLEKDIEFIEYSPFLADIERFKVNGKRCLRYRNPSFSIFKKEMSTEERRLLIEVLNTLGQFDGLANFEWLDKFRMGLGPEGRRKIISFSNNPYLKNSTLLGTLFDHIANEVVVRLSYHTFADATIRCIDFHPYLLKQYNDRWYVLGAADEDRKILSFALDRIDQVEPLPEKKYRECPEDLSDRFEDIVGITFYEDRPAAHIVFWVSDASKGYVETKPIHGSQTPQKGKKEQMLREQYPSLEGGAFFSIDCICNYELIRELSSYGKDLLVLTEGEVRQGIYRRMEEMLKEYNALRT